MQAINYGEFKENQQHLIEFKSQCYSLKSNVCTCHSEMILLYQFVYTALINSFNFFRGLWTGTVPISHI